MPSHSVSVFSIYSKVEDYENRKQNARKHRIRTRENGGSLDLNFTSLPNPTVDENWDLPTYVLLHSLSLKNDAAYD